MQFLNETSEFLNFYGSETLTSYDSIFLTDGALHLAEAYECFWLMDTINAMQRQLLLEEFQVWILQQKDGKYTLMAHDGNVSEDEEETKEMNGKILYNKELMFCDFKAEAVKIFCVNGVVMMPSEY